LTVAVIADDDGVGTVASGDLGIFDVEDAFQNQLATPLLLDPGDVRPKTGAGRIG